MSFFPCTCTSSEYYRPFLRVATLFLCVFSGIVLGIEENRYSVVEGGQLEVCLIALNGEQLSRNVAASVHIEGMHTHNHNLEIRYDFANTCNDLGEPERRRSPHIEIGHLYVCR